MSGAPAEPPDPPEMGQVAECRHVLMRREPVGHVADRSRTSRDPAGAGPGEAGGDPQQRRLAGAVAAEHRDHLAGTDSEMHVAQDRPGPPVPLGDTSQFHDGRWDHGHRGGLRSNVCVMPDTMPARVTARIDPRTVIPWVDSLPGARGYRGRDSGSRR
ncbi:hypothetical protein GCM10009558_046450 [Virgisporangium aurantiacum]